jgi:hypothetical protein
LCSIQRSDFYGAHKRAELTIGQKLFRIRKDKYGYRRLKLSPLNAGYWRSELTFLLRQSAVLPAFDLI